MKRYLQQTTSAAPLAVFRIGLGLLLFASVIRFWMKGWIYDLYIKPDYFFSFYGFEFVKPIGNYTYILFAICGLCALLVAIGLFYRLAATALFISFTYIELMDKSTYLNHYYFISMVCLLMIFLPAHSYFSVDAYRRKDFGAQRIPLWCLDSIKLFVAMLYVFAGLAKVNSDWLIHAQPLRIWLPAKNDLPFIGSLFNYVWVAYAFSWFGCLYDLTIPFFLARKSTRVFAYAAVIIFHMLTSILFPIGMFPYVMIATGLIFFSAEFHEEVISRIKSLFRLPKTVPSVEVYHYPRRSSIIVQVFLVVFFSIHISMPFRYMLYPGELFWTEEGYRFSWRVMLMEKAGYAQFTVKDQTGKIIMVDNAKFLTPLQEKMMSTQPDMILQYAHMLRNYYSRQGLQSPKVFVESFVTINGRLSRPFINNLTDLAQEEDSITPKAWILPFENEIKGF
jgi:uncharacterized membrane protein YphA (DoxX/SURF4 family)